MAENGAQMEMVACYKYLGVNVTSDGKYSEEINHRITEARRAAGTI